MDRFEQYLINNCPSVKTFHPYFNEALKQMLIGGGKRFRPKLLLSVVQALNPLMIEGAFPVALALEIFHTYSLIHDDLPSMDNADLRRGIPTLHTTYDEATAVLIGDAFNTYPFLLIAEAPLSAEVKIACVKALAFNGGLHGMVLGQAIDCYFGTPCISQKLSVNELTFLHQCKTGMLIASSLKMGAIIVGESSELAQRLYDFGMILGLWFQVRDDIIDETSSSQEAGKTTKRDEGKNSFVTLFGLKGAQQELVNLENKIHTILGEFPFSLQKELRLLLQSYIQFS